MSMARCKTAILQGSYGQIIDIEVQVVRGIPDFQIIGLANKVIKESVGRIKSTIINSGFDFPNKKIIVNLSPANIIKEDSHFDLGIAVAILKATGQLGDIEISNIGFFGELGLFGDLKKVRSAIGLVNIFKNCENRDIIISNQNSSELNFATFSNIKLGESLREVIKILKGEIEFKETERIEIIEKEEVNLKEFSWIFKRQDILRTLQISIAGGHHLMMIGSVGIGKTTIATLYKYLMPRLQTDEVEEIINIYSFADKTQEIVKNNDRPPFRCPKPNIRKSLLFGSTQGNVRVGEVSLAHKGVLFLDEFDILEKENYKLLANILDDKFVNLGKGKKEYKLLADFTLVCATNPCRCGNFGEEELVCTCKSTEIYDFDRKFTGGLMDRIDIKFRVSRSLYMEKDELLNEDEIKRQIEKIKEKVTIARKIQLNRGSLNRDILGSEIDKICKLKTREEKFLKDAYEKLKISPRSYQKILKIARTIADLEEKDRVEIEDIAEALQYRGDKNV